MQKNKQVKHTHGMEWFRFTLRHDRGTTRLTIGPSSGLMAAIAQLLCLEGCPLCAIERIRQVRSPKKKKW